MHTTGLTSLIRPVGTVFTKGYRRVHKDPFIRISTGKGSIVTYRGPWFSNVLTSTGLTALTDTVFSDLSAYCHIGQGTNPPSAGNTTLQNFVGATNSVNAGSTLITARSAPPYYGRYRRTFRFPAGTGTGNITEVGLSNQATDGGLVCRALVRDAVNNPAVIEKRDDEWLDVTYEFRLYPSYIDSDGSPIDGVGTVYIEGVTHNFTLRPALVTNGTYWDGQDSRARLYSDSGYYGKIYEGTSVIGDVTSSPSGASENLDGSNNRVTVAYGPVEIGSGTYPYSRELAMNIPEWIGDFSNGVGAVMIYTGFGCYQMQFSPAIVRDPGNTLSLGFVLMWGDI